jgi:1,4-alpha-glucan branching enzyme
MDKLYGLMNWRNIEGIVYSDIGDPKSVLGCKVVDDGKLIGAFIPDAKSVSIKVDNVKKTYPMEMMDEAGYYATLLPKSTKSNYKFVVEYHDGNVSEYYDAYQFDPGIPYEELKKFNAGICYDVYKYLGAHKTEIRGVKGYSFAVWAPYADRVSVVGEFNMWDGRRNMMERIGDTGVFALFIPEVADGTMYKFEIRKKNSDLVLKADPYAYMSELRPGTASVTFPMEEYKWEDAAWIKARAKKTPVKEAMSIYEVHLGSWKKTEDEREFYNYKEIAPMLAEYVKSMGYTHIELMPVMEHPLDESWGYQVTGYYAATSRYGTPSDLKYFINYMHKEGIGVILDWVPAHFPMDEIGLGRFDGTALYEHENPMQGVHPDWGTYIFNYGRPEVSNFLMANAMFWTEVFHADGLRMDAVASMLYLDYGRQDGQWIPNIYGGNENLEAVEFFKHLNSQFKKRMNGALLIAEDSTAWPMMTGNVEEEGLGFDFKWNMGWMNDFLSYMSTDPYFRKNIYNNVTFSMIYQYSENFLLVFSHDEVVHGKGSMLTKMAGADMNAKFANLRATYGFMMTHPGKKLMFMGQDFAQSNEWYEKVSLSWDEAKEEPNAKMQAFVKALNKLYTSEPALYERDQEFEGFNWINCVSPSNSTVSFIRQGYDKDDMVLVVCNFDTVPFEEFKVGVPRYGKYKEVLNSDAVAFGGTGLVNSRVKVAKKEAYDGREYSITISLPALSVTVLKYEFAEEPVKKTPVKKADTNKKTETKAKTTKSKTAEKIEKEIAIAKEEIEKKEAETIEKVVKTKTTKETVEKKVETPKKVEAPKKEETVKKAPVKKTETPKKEEVAKVAEVPKKEEADKKEIVKKETAPKKAATKKTAKK